MPVASVHCVLHGHIAAVILCCMSLSGNCSWRMTPALWTTLLALLISHLLWTLKTAISLYTVPVSLPLRTAQTKTPEHGPASTASQNPPNSGLPIPVALKLLQFDLWLNHKIESTVCLFFLSFFLFFSFFFFLFFLIESTVLKCRFLGPKLQSLKIQLLYFLSLLINH